MFDLDKKSKYVVACSYGPDSMALLDMLLKEKYAVVVAHVNYHKRKESNFEEQSLRQYCLDKNIPFEVLDTIDLHPDKNFQEWARELRYSFFKKVVEKYGAKAVLVAHQQDDLIETYLMQKERGNIVKNAGIAKKTIVFGVEVIRPLLSYSKQDLLRYDEENNVPYSIDVSNLSDDYKRNQIRHSIVEKLSIAERAKIIKEIESIKPVEVDEKDVWLVSEFLKLSDEQIVVLISSILDKENLHQDISHNFISEIRKALTSKKAYFEIKIAKDIVLSKDYDLVIFVNKEQSLTYLYRLESNSLVDDDLFTIDFRKSFEDRNIKESDFPITVKPLSKDDKILIKDYECSINRLFIDWKVPHYLRQSWPGIYNHEGKLIYVPRYRKEFVDNHPSTFLIKFAKLKL